MTLQTIDDPSYAIEQRFSRPSRLGTDLFTLKSQVRKAKSLREFGTGGGDVGWEEKPFTEKRQ